MRSLILVLPLLFMVGCSKTSQKAGSIATAIDVQWSKASEPSTLGDARVSFDYLGGQRAMLKDGDPNDLTFCTGMTIRVKNLHDSKRLPIKTWMDDGRVKLIDNFGNAYKQLQSPAGRQWHRRFPPPNINPGEAVIDELYFEKLADKAEWFRLELPGENIGQAGTFRIQIEKTDLGKNFPAP